MNTSPKSWYYELIVWLLIGITIIAVVVRLSILGYSVSSYAGLVADDFKHPAEIRLSFNHSTRATYDVYSKLIRISDIRYFSELSQMASGRCYVTLETETDKAPALGWNLPYVQSVRA